MITATTDGKTFHLTAESLEDFELLDALDMHGMHLQYMGTSRRAEQLGFVNVGVTIQVDPDSAGSLRAETGRELARAFGQLVRLGMREAALNGHVGTNAANPQAQESLPTVLEKLQLMLEAIGKTVVQQEAMLKIMRRAHDDVLDVGRPIMTNGGAA